MGEPLHWDAFQNDKLADYNSTWSPLQTNRKENAPSPMTLGAPSSPWPLTPANSMNHTTLTWSPLQTNHKENAVDPFALSAPSSPTNNPANLTKGIISSESIPPSTADLTKVLMMMSEKTAVTSDHMTLSAPSPSPSPSPSLMIHRTPSPSPSPSPMTLSAPSSSSPLTNNPANLINHMTPSPSPSPLPNSPADLMEVESSPSPSPSPTTRGRRPFDCRYCDNKSLRGNSKRKHIASKEHARNAQPCDCPNALDPTKTFTKAFSCREGRFCTGCGGRKPHIVVIDISKMHNPNILKNIESSFLT
jgi:hypothetical protein